MPAAKKSGFKTDAVFFALALICGLGATGASLWSNYGGGAALADIVTFSLWGLAGVLAFLGGRLGEREWWDVSPLVRGVLTALIALGATFAAIAVANFQTKVEVRSTPEGSPKQWISLVRAEAQESGNGTVELVLCQRDRPSADEMAACAVEYEGPKCQYWWVVNVDGEDRAEPDDEISTDPVIPDPDLGGLC